MKIRKWLPVFLILITQSSFSQPVHNLPQAFHPKLFSRFPAVRDLAISPDGKEMFFTAQSILGELSAIVYVKCPDGNCEFAGVAPFSGQWQDLEPSFAPDGLRLYFASNRPLHKDSLVPKDYDIWYVERSSLNSEWKQPVRMDAPVNSEAEEFYPVITSSRNIYFTSDGPGTTGKDDIFIARWNGEQYLKPVPVADSMNSQGYEFNAWVAPDESYMVYTCYNRDGGMGSGDLYISYNNNGKWSAPKNLGDKINSKSMDYCPLVFNGELYFTSKRSGVRNTFQGTPDLLQLINEMNRYDNGSSRIYKVKTDWKP
jgi:hypothetical protein